ncbi:MAG: hypothetical protein DRI36_04030, partial [Caldiserica bacterium]
MKKFSVIFLLLCVTLFAKEYEVKFEFRSPYKANMVYLTGDFANWNPTAYPMKYNMQDDTWRIKIKLKEGRYLYKFVINGSDWKHDPNNPKKVPDGYGGFNSVLEVGEAYKLEFNEKRGDGKIRNEGIGFSIEENKYYDPYSENGIRFIVRTAKNDVEKVYLYINGAKKTYYELKLIRSDDRFDYY